MHPNNGRVDHLYRRVVGASQRVLDVSPPACPPPANEAIVAGSRDQNCRAGRARGGTGPQNPKDAIRGRGGRSPVLRREACSAASA